MTRKSTPLRLFCIVALAVAASSCGLKDIMRQTEIAESVRRVDGTVEVTSGKTGTVHVFAVQPGPSPTEFVTVHNVMADPDGKFRMPLVPGEYIFAAYQDVNGDGEYQAAVEPANFYTTDGRQPRLFAVSATANLELPEPLVVGAPLRGMTDVRSVDGSLAATRNIGRVVDLDDPMFSVDNAAMGMWRPVDFLLNVGGGLFMLQPYRPDAIPVVFVHGINGNPADMAPMVERLDKTRYQPWVVYYPSGMRLDVVSDYLDRAIDLLQVRHGFRGVIVVAHSMGGLVARSFVQKHAARGHAAPVRLLMTINSPMLGMASATTGVEHSPVVVPAWRDVAAGSDFLATLRKEPLPAGVEYHLVFSFEAGSDGDGVATLGSQLPLYLQDQATRLHGFPGTHAGVLRDQDFLDRFVAIMAAPRPPAALPVAAR